MQPDEYVAALPPTRGAGTDAPRRCDYHAKKRRLLADMGRCKPRERRAWSRLMLLPPSVVVDAAGGYRAYHLLALFVPVNKDKSHGIVADVPSGGNLQLVGSDKNANLTSPRAACARHGQLQATIWPPTPQAHIVQAGLGGSFWISLRRSPNTAPERSHVASMARPTAITPVTRSKTAGALRQPGGARRR